MDRMTTQGIIRCRAEVGRQGGRAAMESPKALIAPLKRGLEGLRPLGQSPNEEHRLGGFKDLTLFYHLVVILFARERLRERDGRIA